MFTFGPRSSGGTTSSFILAFKQNVVGNVVDVPAHNANDFIVLVARGASVGTVPNLPAGWTNILTVNPPVGLAFRIMSIIDTAGTIATITVVNGWQLFGVIYRNANATGVIGNPGESGPATSFVLPSLSLANTYGPSRVFTGLSDNQSATDPSNPAGHARLWDNVVPNLGGGWIGAFDVVPGSSYTGGTVAGLTNGYAAPWSVEILASP